MPIRFYCPSCGIKLKVPDGYEGKRIKCSNPKCGFVQVVPAESTRPETALEDAEIKEGKASEVDDEVQRIAGPSRSLPKPQPGGRDAEEEEQTDASDESSTDPLAALAASAGNDGGGEKPKAVKPPPRVPPKEAEPARPSRPAGPAVKPAASPAEEEPSQPEADEDGGEEVEDSGDVSDEEQEDERPSRPATPSPRAKKAAVDPGESAGVQDTEEEGEEEQHAARPSMPTPKVTGRPPAKPTPPKTSTPAPPPPVAKKKEESDDDATEEIAFDLEQSGSPSGSKSQSGAKRGSAVSASPLSMQRPPGISAKAPGYGMLIALGWLLRLAAGVGLVASVMLYNKDDAPQSRQTAEFVAPAAPAAKPAAPVAPPSTQPGDAAAAPAVVAAPVPTAPPKVIVIEQRPTVPLSRWGLLIGIVVSLAAWGVGEAMFVIRDVGRSTHR